jgi:hypothetical protein
MNHNDIIKPETTISDYGISYEHMQTLRSQMLKTAEQKMDQKPYIRKSYMGNMIHYSQRPQDGKMW